MVNNELTKYRHMRVRLTESDLHKIVKESAKRIMREVALKGKSGKTYSLHGTDPESWAVMSRVRGKNGYSPRTPQHYHACRDEDNWIELDDKAHPNLRSRNNANRINAMLNRIDDKSKDIMAANESKLNRIVKESVNRAIRKKQRLTEDIYVGNGGGYYGGSAIFTVRMEGGVPTSYEFSPPGWDFDTKSQLEAAAVCASANKPFLEQMKNSELTQLPLAQFTEQDKADALFWLTGGNAEWFNGYWSTGGATWKEAEKILLNDADIMGLLNTAISNSRNFYELVINLKKGEYLAYAADVIPRRDDDEDGY